MQIRLYRENDRQAWDQFVLNHPRGTFFHLTGWKRVVEESFGHRSAYLIAERHDNRFPPGNGAGPDGSKAIAGIFPLFVVKSFFFGNSMVSVPFATCGGILAEDQETERALFGKATEITRAEDLDYLEIRNAQNSLPDLLIKDLYYNFKKELFPGQEENLKAIPRKQRRMVRVGIANGLEPIFGGTELLNDFYDLFAYNYRSLGTPVFSKRYLANLLQEFTGSSSVLIIRKDGNPVSGVISFYFKDEVIPYYSGAYPTARDCAGNDFLYWALMCNALERGCRVFDFGRSKKDTGSFHFKKHWGFEPSPLPYQFYLHKVSELPNISPANPKYRQRIELWKKLPLELTKLVGPRIIKYIP